MFEYFLLLIVVMNSGETHEEEVAVYNSSVTCNQAKQKMTEYVAPLKVNADVKSYTFLCEGWINSNSET